MNVTCPGCRSVFRVDPNKVPQGGVRARCSICHGVIAIEGAAGVESHASALCVPPVTGPVTTAASVVRADASAQPATPTLVAPTAATVRSPGGPAHRPQRPDPKAAAVRRPINPFLADDRDQKARRLARALISDMIAYHPEQHAEGHRAGTLRELFRDEIRKSYEEYVDHVGKEFAESTPHFRDALNDLLGGGKKVF